jgi:hypothetical protein
MKSRCPRLVDDAIVRREIMRPENANVRESTHKASASGLVVSPDMTVA